MRRFALLFVMLAGFSTGGEAQTCQVDTQYFWDCASCPGGRELSPTGRVYRMNRWSFGGKEYLIISNYTSANIYNVTNPANPVLALEGVAYTPWGLSEGSPDDDTEQWDLALLPDNPTGLGMFQNFGWVTFNVTTNNQGALTGFQPLQRYRITPPNYIPTSRGARNAALFVAANGKTYAAAAYLAQAQSTGGVDLADMSNPSSLQVVNTLQNTGANGLIRIVGSGSGAHLLTVDLTGNNLLVFNVSNPAQAGQVAQLSFPGIKDFEVWQNRLYVVYKPSSTVSASVYDISNPASPQQLFNVPGLSWQYNNVTGIGDYLVVSSSSNETTDLPVRAYDITHPTTPVSFPIEPPGGSWFQETEQDTVVYDGGTSLYFYRAAWGRASRTGIPKSCFSTDPQPAFTVTGGSSAACSGNPTGGSAGLAGKGFPGDTFTITDSSGGVITTRQLEIRRASDNQLVQQWGPVASWSGPLVWSPATNEVPGEYWVTLTLTDSTGAPYTLKKSIWLCATPQATLTRTPDQASYLLNTQLTLDGTQSQGHPVSYDFYLWPPGATTPQVSASTAGTFVTTLNACGVYKAALVAHYNHAGAADSCSGQSWYTDSNPNSYDACTTPVNFSVSGATVTLVAKQNGQVTITPLAGLPVDLVFTVQGGTPTGATWQSSPSVSAIDNCQTQIQNNTGTCTVPANTLNPGTQYTITVNVTIPGIPQGCEPTPPTLQITASNVAASFTATPTNPNIGQNVTLQLASVTGTFASMRYVFEGATTCSGDSQTSLWCSLEQCNAGSTETVAFANAGTVNIKLYGTPTTGSEVLLDQKAVTVANQGSCGGTGSGTLTVTATPSSAQVGQQVKFSFTGNPPIPSSGSGSFTATFGDGSAPSTLSWPCSLLCQFFHTYTAAGTFTVTITGTVDGVSYTGSTQVVVGGGGGGGGGDGTPLTLSVSPSAPQVGQTVTFSISGPPPNGSGSISVNTGEGVKTISYPCDLGLCVTTHAYQTAGTKTVTASGTVNGVTYSGSTTVTVQSNCTEPQAPVADFTWSPAQPRAGQAVQFTDTSTGHPTSWSWNFGDGVRPLIPPGTSTQQNPTRTFQNEGTYTVRLEASNCKGTSVKEKQITVLPACGESAVPTADFTWQPVEPTSEQVCQTFPAQCSKQPYTGQKVKLTDASTNNPTDWQWYDFQELNLNFTGQATVTVQWAQPGDKNVRLKAKNCVGWSDEKLKTVKIYADERPVTADFDPPANLSAGNEVTLTAKTGFAYGDPTEFTWEIQDPKPGEPNPVKLTGNPVKYSFKCGGQREVKLTAKRGTYTGTVTKTVEVLGQTCGPEALVAADAVKATGQNNTNWLTDVWIFNPRQGPIDVQVYLLKSGQGNANPQDYLERTLQGGETWVLQDVIQRFKVEKGVEADKGALQVRYSPEGTPPVVVARTYNDMRHAGGGTYGQLIPTVAVTPGIMPREQWITGLRHDGTGGEGFRTNVSLYNLRPSEARLDLYLYDAQGQLKAVKQGKTIAPLGYEQAPILSFFNLSDPLGVAAVKLVLAQATEVGFNASVVDNRTGDANLRTNEPPFQGREIVIPGIARKPGEAGSVWRSSLTLTNPNPETTITFPVKLIFKEPEGTEPMTREFAVPGNGTLEIPDIVERFFSPGQPPEKVSGTLILTPVSGLFPVVSARTFNLAPNGGTFGQTLKVFHAGNAAGKDTGYRRLYLTGMASEDIARSNLGFVHVGGPTVNFKVWFYDEQGRLLNPDANTPYTVALSETNPWDQDKLENRFRNKGWTLQPNLRVVSAVIEVEGGMGQAYASVIDNLTNDPIFIPAVPAP